MALNYPLSVVIITFNEERNIGRCIDAILSIADEILVVDSYSTDQTRAIAEAKGAKVLLHEFQGYGAQKNWATQQARYDFVLNLDADELPDERLLNVIKKTKSHKTADAYTFNRCNNYCGQWIRHGAWYPDVKCRLYDRRKATWTNAIVHETLQVQPDATSTHLEGDLLHFSYQTSEQHRKQIEKYSTLGANEAFAKQKKSSFVKIILNPLWRFVRDYLLRLGCLDGYYGWLIAKYSAKEVYLKYVKLRNLYKKKH